MKNRQINYSLITGRILSTAVSLFVIAGIIPTTSTAATTSSPPGALSYEIPLGELNKVKKERPAKKDVKTYKKKKVESVTKQPLPNETAQPEKTVATPVTPPVQPPKVAPPALQQPLLTEKTGSVPAGKIDMPVKSAETAITIHHDPYSYIITGKRSTIQTVVSSAASIKEVNCRFRTTENSVYTIVSMTQVPGTQFTYSAILPGLAASSRSLRYSIIAVDSLGNETSSQEFTIAVKSSNVLPGWQLENSTGPIKVRRENREKPLEGFSDPGIIE